MRESKMQRDCIEWARKRYGADLLLVNIHGGGWSNKGFPDLLAMANGKVLAIELKGDSGYKVQPDQLVWQNRFAKSNTDYAVCTSLDEFKEKIREVFYL